MNWNSLRNRMIGLRNRDNKTCYINAALKCLGSTPPLTEWLFEQVDNLNTCRLSKERKFCSICELTKIVLLIHPSPRNKSTESSCATIPSADSIRIHVHLISHHFNCCLSSHLSISSTLPIKPTIIDQIFNIKLLSSGKCQALNYNDLLNVTSYMTSDLFTANDKSQNINLSDNRWFLVDEAHCQHVSSNEVLNHPEAFMLFYAKVYPTSISINESFQQQKITSF
ncbi:unnamed protein product [Rotaria magnacalcarata]|uniref:Peptidase C19 ubiquitin carboxyl-terminal hydrolase domain-containing protein n=1 Tax=Rotaria magnacalcarata TaxID=392030 RepID=A0A8S2VX24_9BILA|nr:unnamed protein product [Rotaria magnacalcarata]